jgi:hypothetical protein
MGGRRPSQASRPILRFTDTPEVMVRVRDLPLTRERVARTIEES